MLRARQRAAEFVAACTTEMVTYTVSTATTATWTISNEREPLPFFLDPEQIAQLTPHINWTERVSARIEAFREWAMQPAMLARAA